MYFKTFDYNLYMLSNMGTSSVLTVMTSISNIVW